MRLQAQGRHGLPAAARSQEGGSPTGPPEGTYRADTFLWDFSASRKVGELISVLGHPPHLWSFIRVALGN